MQSEDTDLESVTLRIANLEIAISVRVVEPGIYSRESVGVQISPQRRATPSSAASAAAPSPVGRPTGAIEFDEALEELAIRAETPQLCAALPLGFLAHLANRLRGQPSSGWTPQARIGRAFRAGVIAARRLRGELRPERSPSLPNLRNSFYICLRGGLVESPFWTSSYPTYALSQRAIEELVSKSTKATSPILLPFEKDEEDVDGFNMAVVFPIMVRAGGFMVASPSSPIAQAALEAVDCGLENIEPAVYHGTLQLETTRGRRLGEADAILVDFPWAAATAFSPSSVMKSLPPGEVKAIQFTKDNALGRPTRQSAEDLAARWIGSTLDEETAQEYLTGEELEPVEEPERSPPPRVGKQEAARPLRPKSMAFDHVLADVEKEADEIQTGEDGLDLIAQDGDALSKVMMGQLRQNQLLLQKLLGPRQQDPVLGALSGSTGSDSGSASSGVKGCLARDAFIRAMTDLQR
eukprot:symbB.v1.2.010015.t1/scaffold645.1/size176818/14